VWYRVGTERERGGVGGQLVPTQVAVELPAEGVTVAVPATVTTSAEQLLQQLSLQREMDYARTATLCLRRGDHVTWLEPSEIVITLPVVFRVYTHTHTART
jgi:hypothetical protein